MQNPRFVADVNIGKLANKLWLLSFDVKFRNDISDTDLLEFLTRGNRVLLTRNRRILMHNVVQHGYLLCSDQPKRQTVEVVLRFYMADQLKPFAYAPKAIQH